VLAAGVLGVGLWDAGGFVPPKLSAPIAQAQAAPTAQASPLPPAIVVSGEGTATASPDVAYLSLGVQSEAATATAATNANSAAMAAIIAAIKGQSVADKDIQTSEFSVDPVYSQPGSNGGQPTVTGYRVSNTVSVTVEDPAISSKVLDAAVKAGVNTNVSIRFAIKNTTALQQQALTQAFQQASAKADAIAKAAGVKVSGVYSVTESTSGPPIVRLAAAATAAVAAAPSVPVQQGQLTVTADLQVAFNYTR
jgi:uncharacterized protein YggE